MPTLAIAALTGRKNEHNFDEFLSISDAQASWMASFRDLLQPFGSLMSGLITGNFAHETIQLYRFDVTFFLFFIFSSLPILVQIHWVEDGR